MGVLLQGGVTETGLSARRAGRPKVRPDFRPFFRPKQGGGDRLNRTFGRPRVRRADKYAEPEVRFNPVSYLVFFRNSLQ